MVPALRPAPKSTRAAAVPVLAPARKRTTFTTARDHQPYIRVAVYEGERQLAKDNHLLGEFMLRESRDALACCERLEKT